MCISSPLGLAAPNEAHSEYLAAIVSSTVAPQKIGLPRFHGREPTWEKTRARKGVGLGVRQMQAKGCLELSEAAGGKEALSP